MKPTTFQPDASFNEIIGATSGLGFMESTTLGQRPNLDGPQQPAMMATQALDAGSKVIPAKSDDPDWNTTSNFPPSRLEADDADADAKVTG